MEIKKQSVVGALLIILCGAAIGNCSHAIQPLSPQTQEATSPSSSPLAGEPISPVSPPYSLAILPFEDYSNRTDLHWLRQAIPDMLVTDLALLPGVHVVSRHRLGEVLREQWLQHRGAFEESASVHLGRLVGARYLLSGMYYLVDGSLVIEGHLVDVERGAVARTVRVSGSVDSVQSVEMDLAMRLSLVFSGSTSGNESAQPDTSSIDHLDTNALHDRMPLVEHTQDFRAEKKRKSYPSNSSMTLRTDTLLSMERLRDLRHAAARLADEIWTNAFSVQLGSPQYESFSHDSLDNVQMFKVLMPVVAQFQPTWFSQAGHPVDVLEATMNATSNTMVLAFQGQDAGASQVFIEAMKSPRRLFVRAIGDGGEVLGVSSQWSWRMDQHIQVRLDGTMELPVSPQILFKGNTAFSGSLLTSHGATIAFDSIVVSVPDEARVISIEPIQEVEHADELDASYVPWIPVLRTWLLQKWMPPVAESIPFGGYLPGNVRRSVVVVSGVGGTVHAAKLIQGDAEDGVAKSIQEVISQLSGQCFAHCESIVPKKQATPKPFQLRLQFELIKDIRFAGLNRKS